MPGGGRPPHHPERSEEPFLSPKGPSLRLRVGIVFFGVQSCILRPAHDVRHRLAEVCRRVGRHRRAAPSDIAIGTNQHGARLVETVGRRSTRPSAIGGASPSPMLIVVIAEALRRRAPGLAAAAGQEDEAVAEEIDRRQARAVALEPRVRSAAPGARRARTG